MKQNNPSGGNTEHLEGIINGIWLVRGLNAVMIYFLKYTDLVLSQRVVYTRKHGSMFITGRKHRSRYAEDHIRGGSNETTQQREKRPKKTD